MWMKMVLAKVVMFEEKGKKKCCFYKLFFGKTVRETSLIFFLILAHSVKRGGKARKNFSDCIYFHGSPSEGVSSFLASFC